MNKYNLLQSRSNNCLYNNILIVITYFTNRVQSVKKNCIVFFFVHHDGRVRFCGISITYELRCCYLQQLKNNSLRKPIL